jgi:hypothetical protein
MRNATVEPGQLRQWTDGSGQPFMILEVDRNRTMWNVKFLKADGKLSEYHEKIIRQSSQVLNAS